MKYSYAIELAAGLGFEWDYENAPAYDLYEALEGMGYTWVPERGSWLSADYLARHAIPPTEKRPRRRRPTDAERLRQWNDQEPIRNNQQPTTKKGN